ncbi:MAG: helix-turn-helix domain-containing protein [Butyrivibrio sp.]|nr:helix-turn-helix domain-containing protein [Butyrivibrio sp.]
MTKEQWLAIKSHDPKYDGKFFYAVKTSKAVCRPSCHAKSCKPDNVIIFNTLEDAFNAGYHPCNRCRPDIPEWKGAKHAVATRAREYIENHFTEKITLDEMEKDLYIDKIYLSKCFKEVMGETLLHYHHLVRCNHACEMLPNPELNIDIISSRVGYSTSSHFARIFRSIYHCSPTEYRKRYLGSLDRS